MGPVIPRTSFPHRDNLVHPSAPHVLRRSFSHPSAPVAAATNVLRTSKSDTPHSPDGAPPVEAQGGQKLRQSTPEPASESSLIRPRRTPARRGIQCTWHATRGTGGLIARHTWVSTRKSFRTEYSPLPRALEAAARRTTTPKRVTVFTDAEAATSRLGLEISRSHTEVGFPARKWIRRARPAERWSGMRTRMSGRGW
jgi:hypothetical protein